MQISATSRPIPTYKSVTGADHVFWNHLLFISEKNSSAPKEKILMEPCHCRQMWVSIQKQKKKYKKSGKCPVCKDGRIVAAAF
ncbi:MAG TPA: hypothetical protein DEB50_01345 [Desulfobacter sp.]|nr:hypothetical protein [Desulfobacter sp.]